MSPHWFLVDWGACLGGGGEGEVFMGRSLGSWELCAVKVSVCVDPQSARDQLSQELDLWRRAAGEGVVGLVAWNLDAPRPFLVFELAHAGTLADEMRELRQQQRVYHPVRALERIREVLVALSHVHARGLVHRDVKPANLLRFGHTIKVTDFGTGHSLGPSPAIQAEAFVGTRAYAAPEQLLGEEVDERSDLYAVGCILREMLTGAPARPAASRQLFGQYPHLLVLPELHQLLASLLAEHRSERPATAAAALRRVDAVLTSYATARRVWQSLSLGPSPY
jgi:serine/threonine-protein kinase